MASGSWRIWIDTGGTFTDGVAVAPDGEVHRAKILSSAALRGEVQRAVGPTAIEIGQSWSGREGLVPGMRFRRLDAPGDAIEVVGLRHGVLRLARPPAETPSAGSAFELSSDEPAPIVIARLLTGTGAGQELPSANLRLATTLGTNALLERRGEPTALFVTAGFADLLTIGDQQRPDLFALAIRRSAPLHEAVVEVPGRLAPDGDEIAPLDLDAVSERARALRDGGIRSAAVSLLHAYRNPDHERRVADRLKELGFDYVACSAELAPRIKLLPRTQTAVVDAYLGPLVGRYLERVESSLGAGSLLVMTSAGGLLDTHRFRPKDSLLSGPAGGVVGAARAGRVAGFEDVISFDMGGTSTDVARYGGEHEYLFEQRVGDATIVAPGLAIETVAAGGGSICWLDDDRLRVGPQSAGASPGPACYGAGGPLTVTDVNLLLGRIDPDGFEIPTRIEPAQRRFEALLEQLCDRNGERPEPEAVLEGLIRIADETMADAIRRISVRRGYDPATHALVAFGGAGAQHACGVATRLGIETVVVPPDAALLSAVGLGHAVVERFAERQVLQPLETVRDRLTDWLDELSREATDQVARIGVAPNRIRTRRKTLYLRLVGQETTLEIDGNDLDTIDRDFARAYARVYGQAPEARPLELESIGVVAAELAGAPAAGADRPAVPPTHATAAGTRRVRFAGGWCEVPRYPRDSLSAGAGFDGPALVVERHTASVVPPGWRGRVGPAGTLILNRSAPESATPDRSPEAIRLELFTQRFSALVGEMGVRLERTAISTNVKERLDFSCALLDGAGQLVVNAPHIPVHLGALGLCVRRLIDAIELGPGDVVMTNHPSFGGSHLPDVTVVTPVHVEGSETPLAFLASRAHHSEIGGVRPGSMPPNSRHLAEEGVVIPPTYLVHRGEPRWAEAAALLSDAPHPTRCLADNLADLRAAVAANHHGAIALRRLAETHGPATLTRYMERLARLAARRVGDALRRHGDGTYRAREALDDGTPLAVTIVLKDGRAEFDFAGSGDVHPGNLNVTPAIVRSAVLYVLRLLLNEPLPLNEGLMRVASIRTPPGLLDPDFSGDPAAAPAVVGGSVETSQRIVDTLLKALGLAACSQGTMNNVIFGNAGYGYYETVCGGAGAGPGFPGTSGVHTHMTNTRITDPEILEHRYPVRLERFGLRPGSGGHGQFRGGDGVVRELTFLEPASLSLLGQHRVERPYGLAGGSPGSRGRQAIVRADGSRLPLEGIDGCEVEAGDRLLLETPGGGGYGTPPCDEKEP